MADINRVSEQVLDYAQRFADVVDAAQGRGNRKGTLSARWLILPLAGAGAYALMTSGAFTRQARGVLNDAKERASELPGDLLGRVRQTGAGSTNGRKALAACEEVDDPQPYRSTQPQDEQDRFVALNESRRLLPRPERAE